METIIDKLGRKLEGYKEIAEYCTGSPDNWRQYYTKCNSGRFPCCRDASNRIVTYTNVVDEWIRQQLLLSMQGKRGFDPEIVLTHAEEPSDDT